MNEVRLRVAVMAATGIAVWATAAPKPSAAGPAPAVATQPVLEAEIADTARLRPLKEHDLLVGRLQGGVRIIDGDSLGHVAQLYTAPHSNFAVDPGGNFFYVAESYWSEGNRGTRRDLVAVYAGDTLNLAAEITLPGRLFSDPKSANFDISSDGHYGYVYNFEPASSVVIVDLRTRKVSASVSTPGCGLVYAWGDHGFASLCADGSLATGSANGKGTFVRSTTFFDAGRDPIFDESVVDRKTGRALLMSYTGLLYDTQLAEHPQISRPWSIQHAAGLSAATTNAGVVTWRPGGERFSAYHRASGRLFVLMHEGVHWTQAQDGTEVWVLDTASHELIARYPIPEAASSLAVTQDAAALLFVLSEEWLWVLRADTGAVLRTARGKSGNFVAVRDF